METLNSLVAYYQNTGLGLAEIVKRLSLRIYDYPRSKFQTSEDDCGEFYLFFYPRLLRTLSRFQDRGKPFEWYFNSVLRWHYKAYCSRKRAQQARWAAAREAIFWEFPDPLSVQSLPVSIPGCSGKIVSLGRFGGARDATSRKRILYLALKNARHLDDPAITWISGLTGIGEDRLTGMVEVLRANLYKRELRLHRLYRRQNKIFTRIFLLQRELLWEGDPAAKAKLALALSELRTLLQAVQSRIRRVRLHPSNREIAELLNIPKGTVDTSLYWLRRQLLQNKTVGGPGQQPRLCA